MFFPITVEVMMSERRRQPLPDGTYPCSATITVENGYAVVTLHVEGGWPDGVIFPLGDGSGQLATSYSYPERRVISRNFKPRFVAEP